MLFLQYSVALENRTVSVFIPGKKYGDDMDQQISFPIRCNFWALADAASPSKKTAKCDNAVLGAVVGLSHVILFKRGFYSETRMLLLDFCSHTF